MIICAGEIEQFEFAKPMGIGLIDTAINLTKECLKNKPNEIIFVGSAGSYGNKQIFDIVQSRISTNIENSFFESGAYTPTVNKISLTGGVSHETIVVNSSNYITTNFNLSKLYLAQNIEIENMEFFSVLKVAKEFNIPAKGIFIVTNYCNRDAHKDFIKNHKKAIELLTNYIKKEEI